MNKLNVYDYHGRADVFEFHCQFGAGRSPDWLLLYRSLSCEYSTHELLSKTSYRGAYSKVTHRPVWLRANLERSERSTILETAYASFNPFSRLLGLSSR